jgi:hypothetical protein
VFENRVLRRIFGPKRNEVTGSWRKLHNVEELQDLYSSPNIIRMIKIKMMRWAGLVEQMREKGNKYRILVQRPEGKSPPGRTSSRRVDNIKMVLRDIC